MGSTDRQYGWLYPAARAVLRPTFRFAWRIRLVGGGNVPADGPAILCPNHTSVLDSFLLPAMLPRRIMFVGKSEYLDDWKTRHLFPALGMIPIDRSGGDAAQRALDTAARVLDRGELFGIYPEGTRSRDGVLRRGRTGAARLAVRTGAPLVPVGIVGTREIQPPEAKVPSLFRTCEIRIGRPIDPHHHRDAAEERMVLRQVTDELMYEIRSLSGQDYEDEYHGGRREPAPAPAVPATAAAVAAADVVEPADLAERRGRTPAPGSRAALLRVMVEGEAFDGRRSSADVLSPPA